ncbi:hypothetical protein TIFTF001_021722 [Ficus carica]|uniref:Uncharacterized protein n=1 Tax=Ficus carica TaxID=3494 RepID=A0AA88DJV0_FICCA|nr:hypothetical protein TIFTF001_021722 [Ficus carica]
MSLEYHAAAIYKRPSRQGNIYECEESNDTMLVAFEINLGPNERPFLCQWTWSLHDPPIVLMLSRCCSTYDISFPLTPVCMKIAYLAVPDQSDSSSDNFVFPDFDLC